MIQPSDRVKFSDRAGDGAWIVVDVTGDGMIILRRSHDEEGKEMIAATEEQLTLW